MKKLNITKEQFNKSKYFKNKYGNLEYVSESGKLFKTDKGQVLKFKESVGDVSTDPAYVCPYCGHNNCEFVDADDYPEEGYFDDATFNAQFWCKDCEMLYNVTYELKVKEVTPNEDYHKDDLPDDWA